MHKITNLGIIKESFWESIQSVETTEFRTIILKIQEKISVAFSWEKWHAQVSYGLSPVYTIMRFFYHSTLYSYTRISRKAEPNVYVVLLSTSYCGLGSNALASMRPLKRAKRAPLWLWGRLTQKLDFVHIFTFFW